MTPELWAALIGAVVLFLTNTAAAVKLWVEVHKQKADRAEVGARRDKDSQELHDLVLKHSFMISELRDNQAHHAQVFDDLRDQVCALNVTVAELTITIKNLMEKITELKKEK